MKKLFFISAICLAIPASAQEATQDHARTVCLQLLNEANVRVLDVTALRQSSLAEIDRLQKENAELRAKLKDKK